MSIEIFGKNILGFLLYIIIQLLIFNNIGISSLEIVPVFYLIFLIMLPIETPKWMLLISAFFMGLSIDIFSDTSGLNAFSTVLIAFLRPFVVQYLSPRGGYDTGTLPRIRIMGANWFIKYSGLLIFIHQFSYYFMENFGFEDFFYVFLKVIIGSIFTLILVILSQYIIFRK